MEALEDEIPCMKGQMVVGGGFNATALEWRMSHFDFRRKLILEMEEPTRVGLFLLNVREATTFRRLGCAETIPYLTFASEILVLLIQSWIVMRDYYGSPPA